VQRGLDPSPARFASTLSDKGRGLPSLRFHPRFVCSCRLIRIPPCQQLRVGHVVEEVEAFDRAPAFDELAQRARSFFRFLASALIDELKQHDAVVEAIAQKTNWNPAMRKAALEYVERAALKSRAAD